MGRDDTDLGDGFRMRPRGSSWELSGPQGFMTIVLHGEHGQAVIDARSRKDEWMRRWSSFPDATG